MKRRYVEYDDDDDDDEYASDEDDDEDEAERDEDEADEAEEDDDDDDEPVVVNTVLGLGAPDYATPLWGSASGVRPLGLEAPEDQMHFREGAPITLVLAASDRGGTGPSKASPAMAMTGCAALWHRTVNGHASPSEAPTRTSSPFGFEPPQLALQHEAVTPETAFRDVILEQPCMGTTITPILMGAASDDDLTKPLLPASRLSSFVCVHEMRERRQCILRFDQVPSPSYQESRAGCHRARRSRRPSRR